MKRIAVPTYRFGAAAEAIGVNDQTLRNWLFRGKDLDLFTERPPGGWRSFEERDVWVLALVVEFMRFGASINEAVDAARQALGLSNPRTLEDVPRYLYAAPGGDGWGWVVNEEKGMVLEVSGSPSVVEIPMQQVLGRAVSRLKAEP